MSGRNEVKRFDLILASLGGVLLLSYLLGFYYSSFPEKLNGILECISKSVPINNFIAHKLATQGRLEDVPRLLATTGLSYLGFALVSIATICTAIKCSPQSMPFKVGLSSFNTLLFVCLGIGIFAVAPSALGTSGKLTRLLIYSDFRYFIYFCYFVFVISFEFLITFQIKEYYKSKKREDEA